MQHSFKMTEIHTIDYMYKASVRVIAENNKLNDLVVSSMKLTNNNDRVKIIYNMVKEKQLLPSVTAEEKCEEASITFRNLGNNYHKNKQYYEALQLYNLALLHSPSRSSSMALALGNRSAVLFSMRYYNDCLIDIEMVLKMNLKHSQDFSCRLEDRKNRCIEEISKQDVCKDISFDKEYWHNFVKVKQPHDSIPCTSSSVKVESNKQMGRHLVACNDIEVGEVIAVEKPYSKLLFKSQYLIRCYCCLKICNNLIPCDYCCFTMFCSNKCKETAWMEYHVTECPLMATLVKMDFKEHELLALRIVIQSRNQCSNWKEFTDMINEAESTLATDYRGYYMRNNPKPVYDSQYYNCVHTLGTNNDLVSLIELYKLSYTASVFLHFLSICTKFFNVDEENIDKESMISIIGGMLLLHIMTCSTNPHCLMPLVESEDGKYIDEVKIGNALYPFMSLINHACSPNVTRTYHGTEMVLIALRPIKSGMQIFDNYGYHHIKMASKERRSILRLEYKFECACQACKYDWPINNMLKSASRKDKELICKVLDDKTIERLYMGDINLAIAKFPQLCQGAASLEESLPCTEVYNYQEGLKQCLSIMSGSVPRGYNRLYKWY